MPKGICPIMSRTGIDTTGDYAQVNTWEVTCRGKGCAWWTDEGCAIRSLARDIGGIRSRLQYL